MALKGRGRGSILSTEEGQNSNRLRVEFRSYFDGHGAGDVNLPDAGTMQDFIYFTSDNQYLLDEVPDTSDIYDEIQNFPQLEGGSHNRGRLVRFFVNEDDTIIVYAARDKARGYVHRGDDGNDYFRVTLVGSSGTELYEADGTAREYTFSTVTDVSQSTPTRDSVDQVIFQSCTGDSTDCPEFFVCFDAKNDDGNGNGTGTIDADQWAWSEA